jgi:hypothetical protein
MTRAQAQQKWCPFARTAVQTTISEYVGGVTSLMVNKVHVVSGNREHGSPAPNAMCIADKCMAWTAPLADPDHGRCGMVTR